MSATIVIYPLGSKFVNRREDIPENARQVVYYSLAVGHHVGVLDCFSKLVEFPAADLHAWLNTQPSGPGRAKLEGVLRYGEIEINSTHVAALLPLLETAGEEQHAWTVPLSDCLRAMLHEPAFYIMMRKME